MNLVQLNKTKKSKEGIDNCLKSFSGLVEWKKPTKLIARLFVEWLDSTMTHSKLVVQRCFVEEVLLKIKQNPKENTCAGVSFQ